MELTNISLSRLWQALKTLADGGAIRQSIGMASRKDLYVLQADFGFLVGLFLNRKDFSRPKVSERCGAAHKSGIVHGAVCFQELQRWRGKTNPRFGLLRSLASGELGEGLLR